MSQCPHCGVRITLTALFATRASGHNFTSGSMQFGMTCPGCDNVIGLGRNALRLFFFGWLFPLPFLIWVASTWSAGIGLILPPLVWLLLFPAWWLVRMPLVMLRSG